MKTETVAVFEVNMTIMSTKNFLSVKMKLSVEIYRDPNQYGNGMAMYVKGKGKTEFERCFDIRYEKVDPNNIELFILNWIYNEWSGENGSYDVVELKISNVKALELAKKAENPNV